MSSTRPTLVPGSAHASLRRLGALALVGTLVLSGCGESSTTSDASSQAPAAAATSAGATASTGSSVPTAPGYQQGEIPPVPLFVLPDISALTTSPDAFTVDLTTTIQARDGITVAPASCDAAGSFTHGGTSANLYGNGAGEYTSGGTSIINRGNGAGEYDDGTVEIINRGNGAGQYTNRATGLTIVNRGNGTAEVSWPGGDTTVEADPLSPVPALGTFPSLEAISPIESCGTLVTLRDSVLFDFGSSEIRSDAQAVLTELAGVLREANVPAAQVFGHTDSVSDEAFNRTLSEQRAQAVVSALEAAGAPTSFEATGLGESAPIAPNENEDGSDNPAGRQLNRRVEIFIPAF